MEKSENILQELQEISPAVAAINKTNVGAVPDLYFATLADKILQRVSGEANTTLPKANPFEVPGGYFEGLAGNILNKVKSQQSEVYKELADISPLLNTISKQPVFTVPTGYFEQENFKATKPKSKVISFSATKKVLRYAVAAAVTGIMAISSYLYLGNDNGAGPENVNVNVSASVGDLSEEEILGYLETNSSATDAVNIINTEQPIDVDGLIEEMPEEDIREFLNDPTNRGDNS